MPIALKSNDILYRPDCFFQSHLVPIFNLLFGHHGYLLLEKHKNIKIYINVKNMSEPRIRLPKTKRCTILYIHVPLC